MSAQFLPAFRKTLELEGGLALTDNPGDRGGMTYAGISRVYFPNWEGWAVIDAGGDPHLTMVEDFYKVHKWDPFSLGDCLSQNVGNLMFDSAVHHGFTQTTKFFQQSVPGLVVDGICGPKTRNALRQTSSLICAPMVAHRLAYMMKIIHNDASQAKWAKGWARRALEFLP